MTYESERLGRLPQLVARPWVGCLFDDFASLAILAMTEDLGAAVFCDDHRVLEGASGLVQLWHDAGAAALLVP